MNAEEPMDLAKMAVSAMLLTLLLGIASTLFYFLYVNLSNKQDATKEIVNSASMDKFYYLEQQSRTADGGSGEYPLVSSLVNAFSELDYGDVVYYDIYYTNKAGTVVRKCFVLDSGSLGYTGVPADAVKTQNMTTEVSKYLMAFIGNRCRIVFSNPLDNGVIGVQVYVIN